MSRQHSTRDNVARIGLLIVVFSLLTSPVFSEERKKNIEGPIVITSQRLTSDNKTGTAVFEGSVVAQTSDMTLYADKMTVFYEEKKGDVTRIDAEGNVRLLKEKWVITSMKATYFSDTEKVIFTGEPRAAEGENVVTGSTMTYFMAEDRFTVEDSKVFLTNKKSEA